MFCLCSFPGAVDRGVRKEGRDAVPDNGTAVERREAPGPTLLGPRARKRQPLVTGDLPWRAPDPGFEKEKGKDGPARAPEKKPGFAKSCLDEN
jgi:hypothetical protein